MIARIWRGRTPSDKADAYHDYLRATGLKEYAETPGNRGVFALRRIDGDVAEFLLLTLWESMDAVRAFAGDDPERPVYYPEDDDYLLEREQAASHYEVLEAPRGFGAWGRGQSRGGMEERERPGEDPTIEADRASPEEPGPGDSEGAKPEPPPDEEQDGDPDARSS